MGQIIRGEVVGGNKIGRKIGFPTANIRVGESLKATDGVYAARVETDGKQYGAMVNLGYKPSVPGDGMRMLEVHLFGFTGDLYGKTITVELLEYIRPEQRFDSFDQLREQIGRDREVIEKKL